jgi:DNA-binding transcriptional MerR regulator
MHPTPSNPPRLVEYLKRAFLYRWNMLLFWGGVAGAILSPWPDAVLPLVVALETAYLGGLVAHPRFREAIDAQVHKETQGTKALAATQSLAGILGGLPQPARQRFERLRGRCLEMRSIAHRVRGGDQRPEADLSTPAIDRLLWVFLRLLVSDDALTRFLAGLNVHEIRARLEENKRRLQAAQGGEERILRSLEDNVAAQQARLENYERAEHNAEFVQLELDRVETKIQALIESAVNQQDPNVLTSQIEGVTESMRSTEKAIRELNELTGMVDQMQEPPAILEADLRQVAR